MPRLCGGALPAPPLPPTRLYPLPDSKPSWPYLLTHRTIAMTLFFPHLPMNPLFCFYYSLFLCQYFNLIVWMYFIPYCISLTLHTNCTPSHTVPVVPYTLFPPYHCTFVISHWLHHLFLFYILYLTVSPYLVVPAPHSLLSSSQNLPFFIWPHH